MLNKEQEKQIKESLLKQVENFPEEQQRVIKEKILSMSSKELEEFIKQNELNPPECIFCSIYQNKIPAYKIIEDNENLAILEINPISKAHTLIIPKKHSGELLTSSHEFAKKIFELIAVKFNPKQIQIKTNKISNHSIIELIPIYENQNPDNKRTKASEEELKKIQQILIAPIKQLKIEKQKKLKRKPLPKLKMRRP